MPVHVHTAILDCIVVVGGSVMIFGAFATALAHPQLVPRECALLRHGHFTTGGMEERIESTLPPVRRPKMVPRS